MRAQLGLHAPLAHVLLGSLGHYRRFAGDFWARVDGTVNTSISGRVSTHGGWGPATSRW